MRDTCDPVLGTSMVERSIIFVKDPAATEIYTLSLHDALPIFGRCDLWRRGADDRCEPPRLGLVLETDAEHGQGNPADRKSTRLNSSHGYISYAVFCLKKKSTSTTRRKTTLLAASTSSRTT